MANYLLTNNVFTLAGTINNVTMSDVNYDDLKSHIIDNQNIIKWILSILSLYDRIEYSIQLIYKCLYIIIVGI